MNWTTINGGRAEYSLAGAKWVWSVWLCGRCEGESVRVLLAQGSADGLDGARAAVLLAWAESGHEGHELREVEVYEAGELRLGRFPAEVGA